MGQQICGNNLWGAASQSSSPNSRPGVSSILTGRPMESSYCSRVVKPTAISSCLAISVDSVHYLGAINLLNAVVLAEPINSQVVGYSPGNKRVSRLFPFTTDSDPLSPTRHLSSDHAGKFSGCWRTDEHFPSL